MNHPVLLVYIYYISTVFFFHFSEEFTNYVQILYILNFLDITSKFSISTMFVIAYLLTNTSYIVLCVNDVYELSLY